MLRALPGKALTRPGKIMAIGFHVLNSVTKKAGTHPVTTEAETSIIFESGH
jgi:hypothetical protein